MRMVGLEVNLSFKRSAANAAAVVALTNDPNAPQVAISEEDIRKLFLGTIVSSQRAACRASHCKPFFGGVGTCSSPSYN